MNKQLMDVVLPRLARPLYRQLRRYRSGELGEVEFTRDFEAMLQRQHAWLASRGVSEARAALAIHAAILVLSSPGLRAEAAETGKPTEVVEFEAIREAAEDVAHNYGLDVREATRIISRMVARYGD